MITNSVINVKRYALWIEYSLTPHNVVFVGLQDLLWWLEIFEPNGGV
jgi:hypothetical protein